MKIYTVRKDKPTKMTKNLIIDKEYYRKKAPQDFKYCGFWDGLLHYSKPVQVYNDRYTAIRIIKNGILFRDTLEKNWIKRKNGVFKSNKEIELFTKTTKYQTVSCTLEQAENNDLEFMAKHGFTY